MHITEIELKDGRKFKDVIEAIRFDPDVFEHSYIKFFGEEPFYIKDIKSEVTKNERISINKRGDLDEIKSIKEYWEMYQRGEIRGLSLVEEKYKLPSE